ncbi:hypothetical protein [Bacillus sp. KH172YL63]|uniref:hypothetical protein n=1 Tax=Bacillus sp. KH172YL63 TaxID=2709784 RepID=UPI0013E49268|nr:hypothetical protein [Bacillus sp. KH172YL63]BCB04065.1 hypothetical protein KH172YL63_21980 [Bacillus sp. KH172YL63]
MYVLILLNSTYKGGVLVGGVVLGERQYVRSLRQLREDLWFYNENGVEEYSHSRIQRSIKRLEKCGWLKAEKYEHGYVFTLRPAKDFACREMGTAVKDGGDESGGDQLDDEAGSGRSFCGEQDVEQEWMESANSQKTLENEGALENTTSMNGVKEIGKLQVLIDHFIYRRGRGLILSPMDYLALERISLNELSTDELIAFMDDQFDKQQSVNSRLTIHSPRYLEKALETYLSPRETMEQLDEMLDELEESLREEKNHL